MTLPHDVGGKHGFGPIDVAEVEVPFHADYEGRMWGISRNGGSPDWNIDWWRHVRENIPADDYYGRSYFDSWMQTYAAAHIDSGTFDVVDLIAGAAPEPNPRNIDFADALAENKTKCFKFDAPTDATAKFGIGDAVQTITAGLGTHTRLPEYARGKVGVIHYYRGSHVFPDHSAQGNKHGDHLYTVMFKARELWGDEASGNDVVYLDLWQAYFV